LANESMKGWLTRCPVIAILRGIRPNEAESIGDALEEAGVVIVEVPLNSPDPLASIATLSRAFGDRMLIGAGTVMDTEKVAEVSEAGGRLIVTPHAELSVVRAAKQAGLFAVPGFFNPTEAFSLLKEGADAIKLFPAEVVGPPMLKAMRAVLPRDALVVPVGGIDSSNIAPWTAAGADGFGAGSSIYRPGDNARTVKEKAKSLIAAARIAGEAVHLRPENV
jgi:2-dehydro-3-deoxyphosphogalactonate aldolase